MKETRQSGSIVLDAGVLKVRIPVSQKTPQGQDVPGPIVQLQREDGPRRRSSQSEGGGIGESHIISSRKPIREIVSERVESGDLFITYRLTYQFAGGATYAATVRSVLGHDFVEFLEEMKGLPRGDGVTLEHAWTGFDPTHRFSSSWPYPMGGGKPFKKERSGSYGDYDWVGIDEPIIITNTANGRGPQQTEDPAEEFAFRLAPYAPAVLWEINPHATFWDERGGDSLGVFIQHHEKWNDLEYSLWSSSDILPVRFRYTGKKLYWTWPLVTGTRATGLAYYTHEKDTAAMHDQERNAEELVSMKISAGDALKMTQFPATYTSFLHNRLGAISLNRVKDWVLEYDERHRRPPALFTEGLIGGADEYERRLRPCAFGGPA